MDESRLWGGIGILLALAGVALVWHDIMLIFESGFEEPAALYGLGVAVAVVVTVLIIGPSLVGGE